MSAYVAGNASLREEESDAGDTPTNILLERRARRMAEEDALRLYNRVRQLEKEEEKADKRIVDTRKKAKEIVKLRERNELVKQEKELRLLQLQELIELQKVENARLKEEALRNKIEQENKVFAEKVSVVQQTKDEKAEFERLLAESKLISRKEALEQKEYIRKQQDDARRKLEQLKISRLQGVSAGCGLLPCRLDLHAHGYLMHACTGTGMCIVQCHNVSYVGYAPLCFFVNSILIPSPGLS